MDDAPPLVPVLFGSDRNYMQHTAACIASLVANNPQFRFEIVVVSADDLAEFADKLREPFAGNPNVSITLKQFDLPSDMLFPLSFHYTAETYMRFWVGDFFPDRARALYLDPDIIVTGSIADLWHVDLAGNTIAAVPIPGSTRPAQHGLPADSLYFNAGVLLFDLNAWRRKDYLRTCLHFLNDHPEAAIDSDQDILNLCLVADWLPLPYQWNVISAFYFPWHDLGLSQAEIDTVRAEARIIHFNGGTKPWSYLSEHPRRDDYWKYLRQTAWRQVGQADRTFVNIAKMRVGRKLPPSLKKAIQLRWLAGSG